MFYQMRKISLNNWILIGLILGILTGIFLNLFVDNCFFKDFLINNVFNMGGNLFISLMKTMVVPLVFCSIVVSLSSITDMNKLKTIGGRTLLLYIGTFFIAITMAFIICVTIKPGVGLNMPIATQTSSIMSNQTITYLFIDMIPENFVSALNNGNILQVIIFGIMISYVFLKLGDETSHLQKLFKDLDYLTITATKILMKIAPIGIFFLMAYTFGTFGFESFIFLTKLLICIFIGLSIMNFVVYPLMLIIFTRINPLIFIKQYLPVMMFAFSSDSSNITIPLSLDKLEKMGVANEVASFTVPLGATIHKNGHVIAFTIITLFTAQANGIALDISPILTIIVTIFIMANVATPSVPLGGIFSLNIIFTSIGFPLNILELITGMYNLIDMYDTVVNVTGDAICTIIVAFKDKSFDINAYNRKKEH